MPVVGSLPCDADGTQAEMGNSVGKTPTHRAEGNFRFAGTSQGSETTQILILHPGRHFGI
jgi:hypothetical protein